MTKIVIVEDDEAVRRMYATILRNAGHQVIERENTEGLLDLLKKERPATVLLDLSMPREDGVSACRRIKLTPELAGMRVVMVTAHDSFEAIRQTTAAGADAHLVKPVVTSRLLACVDPSSAPRPRANGFRRMLRSLAR